MKLMNPANKTTGIVRSVMALDAASPHLLASPFPPM
jgi:hypothetical protein